MRMIFILTLLFLLVSCGKSNEREIITFEQVERPADGMLMIRIPAATFALAELGTGGQGKHQVTLDD